MDRDTWDLLLLAMTIFSADRVSNHVYTWHDEVFNIARSQLHAYATFKFLAYLWL